MPGIKPRVLFVDDDRLALEMYSRELGDEYQVTTSESVQEARQHIQNQLLDALIIEPAVNEDEGWALLEEIHSVEKPPVVILCSVQDDRSAGFRHGADAFLVKPVLPAALHELLNRMIAKKPLQSV